MADCVTERRRWWALGMVSAAQLLVVLDGTIVNIALPSAQHELGMSDGARQWVITAYALAFGGLLLIGGRVSGQLGHRRAFVVGLVGFAVSSALGGAAASPGTLFAARALQGVFAALLAPAGLSLLATTFTRAEERGQAFGVFAAVGAAGSAVGLVAGGLLTEYASWRWCLYVNTPVALLAAAGAVLVPRQPPARGEGRLDVAGALLSATGFVAVVYAFNQAESAGWGSPVVLALLGAGVALLAGFAAVEARAPHPLLPPRLLRHRARAGAFATIALTFVAMFGCYLFMTYYLQTSLGYSPIQAGLVLLLHAAAAVVGSMLIAGRLHGRVPPWTVIVPGLVASAAGVFVLTRLTPLSTGILPLYLTPAMLLTGIGMGCVISPTASLATTGVHGHDTGAASATYNAAQQLGAALGTALFNTIATSTAATSTAVHGYTTALTAAFAVLLAAALVATVFRTVPERKH